MSEIQHAIVGYAVLMVLWHVFIKQFFITEKDLTTWQSIIEKFLFKG